MQIAGFLMKRHGDGSYGIYGIVQLSSGGKGEQGKGEQGKGEQSLK